jgi:hypothetical protein
LAIPAVRQWVRVEDFFEEWARMHRLIAFACLAPLPYLASNRLVPSRFFSAAHVLLALLWCAFAASAALGVTVRATAAATAATLLGMAIEASLVVPRLRCHGRAAASRGPLRAR